MPSNFSIFPCGTTLNILPMLYSFSHFSHVGQHLLHVGEPILQQTDDIEVLLLGIYKGTITGDAISALQKLRFLRIQGAKLKGDFMNHLPNLRWLVWHNAPSTFEAVNFHPTNLAVLNLYGSAITENWRGWEQLKAAKKLKVLDLTRCLRLKRTPDFSSFLQLEKLILRNCEKLAELDFSICKLKNLTHLNMEKCRLSMLPENIGDLKSLVELDISHSYYLHELPDSIGNMKNLKVIKMGCSSIKMLPPTIGSLKKLEVMEAQYCQDLMVEFSIGMEGLCSLEILDFSGTTISKFPKSLAGISLLKKLCFCLPNEFEALQFPELPSSLKSLMIGSNYGVHFVPDLSNLTNLTDLDLDLSASSETDLWWIVKLSKLEEMKIRCRGTITLPQKLANLSMLKHIRLQCDRLQCLPELPSQLESLELSDLSNTSCSLVETMPCLKHLRSLHSLKITFCEFRSLDGLQFLSNLRKLWICYYHKGVPDLSSLRKLKHLRFTSCTALVEIQGLGDLISLENLYFNTCSSLEGIDGLSNLRKLTTLQIRSCRKLQKIPAVDQLSHLDTLEIVDCDSLVLDTSNLDIQVLSIANCPNISPQHQP